MLCNISRDDEVIMPSFTFVSTANAFVLRGAKPVFVDIRADNLNIDENLIEAAITERTKAIVVVHYAGVACEMDKIKEIAQKYNLFLLEDAAQALNSFYKNKPLGTIGDIGALSFHETKNIMSGEGGAIFINREDLIERSEIIREKGTNRSLFIQGIVDKYSWVDIGSSYLPSDITAAYLLSSLEMIDIVTQKRLRLWNIYKESLAAISDPEIFTIPNISEDCRHNGHIFYLMFPDNKKRNNFISFMNSFGIGVSFHYIALHSSLAGEKYGRYCGDMSITNKASDCLVRLPLYFDLATESQEFIISKIYEYCKTHKQNL